MKETQANLAKQLVDIASSKDHEGNIVFPKKLIEQKGSQILELFSQIEQKAEPDAKEQNRLKKKLNIDFEKVREDLEVLSKQEIFSKNDINMYIQELERSNAISGKELYCKLIEQIRAQFGEHYIAQLSTLTYLTGNRDKIRLPKRKELIMIQARKGGGAGSITTDINLNERVKNNLRVCAVLKNLALCGYSDDLGTLHHEIIHVYQGCMQDYESVDIANKSLELNAWETKTNQLPVALKSLVHKIIIHWLANRLKQREIRMGERSDIRELHAYIGEGRHRTGYTLCTLVKILSELYPIRGMRGEVSDKQFYDLALEIVQSIKELYALGMGDEEIGRLLQKTWKLKSSAYQTKLRNKVRNIRILKGWSRQDLDIKVLYEDIKQQTLIKQIKFIAQKLLKEAHINLAESVK